MQLVIVLEVEGVDPTLVDPYLVAELALDAMESDPYFRTNLSEIAGDSDEAAATFVSAEWGE